MSGGTQGISQEGLRSGFPGVHHRVVETQGTAPQGFVSRHLHGLPAHNWMADAVGDGYGILFVVNTGRRFDYCGQAMHEIPPVM